MSGGGGPSAAQQEAQQQQLEMAQRAEQRELARERELKVRTLARQRARRFGQFGRQTLAFNPGRKNLGVTGNLSDNPFQAGAKADAAAAANTTRLLGGTDIVDILAPNRRRRRGLTQPAATPAVPLVQGSGSTSTSFRSVSA